MTIPASQIASQTTTSTIAMSMNEQKLLVANRGEIAVRILQTARRLAIRTVAIHTRTDALAPHVLLADESVLLRPTDDVPLSNARGYLDAEAIVEICVERHVTLVHPGYGFLSEDAGFAGMLEERGITLLGPSADVIRDMGLKHTARTIAERAGVPVAPGSDGLLHDVEDAIVVACGVGYPIMLKATAGGGGMGLVVCSDADQLRRTFPSTQDRARVSSRFCG